MEPGSGEATPLDRLVRMGIRGAVPTDLLSIALGDGPDDCREKEDLARAMLRRYGINNLGNLGTADLKELGHLDEYEALRLLCCIELGRRSGLSAKGELRTISGPDDVFKLFSYLADEPQEHFCALLLNSKNGVIGIRTIHKGTINMSIVGPREVFREAIREGAASIIVVHNHPSGDPTPSPEDIDLTLKLMAIGETLDIPVRDHVVVGHHEFVSLKRKKLV
ncbi:MAG: DNA repair protein RadC [Armatimonadetes bacterium]|nr:DNA repair protein RadC [Armatimonadota bacterium]